MSGFDVNCPGIWSGTPFHFLAACVRRGFLDEGLSTCFPSGFSYQARRWTWNARKWLATGEYGGFGASGKFHNLIWAPLTAKVRGTVLIMCGSYLAPCVIVDNSIEKWFFIDQTLRQYFQYPDTRLYWGPRTLDRIFRSEGEAYRAARGVIVHSRWAASSVVQEYGIPPERVHVVVPGANIAVDAYREWEHSVSPQNVASSLDRPRPLTLVCVSRVYYRKGLDRLLGAYRIARLKGFCGKLRIIGCTPAVAPPEYRELDGVEWLGHIDKQREIRRFMDLVGTSDVGVLLSRFEAGGIGLREYHALGLPAIGTDAGGAPEHLNPEASLIAPVSATDEEIAQTILSLQSDWPRFRALKLKAWETRHHALWDHAMSAMARFWPHS